MLVCTAGDKPKRAPSAYNVYVSSHMKPWLDKNPGKTNKDAMKAVSSPFSLPLIVALLLQPLRLYPSPLYLLFECIYAAP